MTPLINATRRRRCEIRGARGFPAAPRSIVGLIADDVIASRPYRTPCLQSENLPEFAPKCILPQRRNAAAYRQYFLAREFDNQVAAARSFMIEPIGVIEEHLVRTDSAIRGSNRATHQAVQVSKVVVTGQMVRRKQNEIVRIHSRGIRQQHDMPLS